jgi:hypothetical protein
MQSNKSNIALLFIGMLFSVSCTEIVEIELDSNYKKLVVYGIITSDSLRHQVTLTSTTDYFYTETPPPVADASVSITYEGATIFFEESEQSGVYVASEAFRGVPGTTYLLNIANVDIDEDGNSETYSASTRMPFIVEADSITMSRFVTPFFSAYQVALWSGDPDETNYYSYKLFRNGTPINEKLADFIVQPDELFRNNYASGLPISFLNDDDEQEAVFPGDIVTVEINSITENYYDFITQAQSEIFGNNPLFSGPPANVSTNIDNDAAGIFTAYAVDRISTIVPMPVFKK